MQCYVNVPSSISKPISITKVHLDHQPQEIVTNTIQNTSELVLSFLDISSMDRMFLLNSQHLKGVYT